MTSDDIDVLRSLGVLGDPEPCDDDAMELAA
jgi:hypothetical protein